MALAMQRRRRDRVVWLSGEEVRAAAMSRAILLWAKKSLLIIPAENSREKQTASSLEVTWTLSLCSVEHSDMFKSKNYF